MEFRFFVPTIFTHNQKVEFMKKFASVALWSVFLCFFASCDFVGDFTFEVNNQTDDTVKVSYSKQLPAYPETYNYNNPYGRGYVRLSGADTTVLIPPRTNFSIRVDAGFVSRDFPTQDDTPERYDIMPLWKRMTCLVIGNDTISPVQYSEGLWNRRSTVYTLNLYRQ